MCSNNQRTMIKPLKLIIQVILFKESFYLLKVILKINSFSVKKLISNAVPANYFVILYITLYFVSPFINLLIERVNEKKCFEKFLISMLILFSVWPTIVDVLQEVIKKEIRGLSTIGAYGSQWGYSIINFSLMYIIGAWIRNKKDTEGKKKCCMLSIVGAVCVLVVWACINDRIGYGVERSAWEYCNPVVVFIAVEVFLLFKQIEITNNLLSRIINHLAKGSFTVFLLHSYFLSYIDIPQFVTENGLIMVLHLIISVITIYLICWCVSEVYEHITCPIYNILSKRFPILVKNVFNDL